MYKQTPFPPLEAALDDPNGLLAAGGDLSVQRLLAAYRHGAFPWYSEGQPILWWSPDPRMVLYTEDFKLSRSLRKSLRSTELELRVDSAFAAVMVACAEPRSGQNGTWINSAVINAYGALHRLGYAHSIETWRGNELVGGLYGVAVGRMFFGESMFFRERDASKIAFSCLVLQLRQWKFPLIDCQQETAHLSSLGARLIPRKRFAYELAELVDLPPVPSPWRFDSWLG